MVADPAMVDGRHAHAVGIGGIALGHADLLLPWTTMNH